MARTRYIKPEFFLDEKLSELLPLSRILFQGLWCLADREGRLEYSPKRIKVQILPYDDYDTETELLEMHKMRLITIYEVEDKLFIQINNFLKHQKPHSTEKASEIPDVADGNVLVTEELALNNVGATKNNAPNINFNSNSNFNSNINSKSCVKSRTKLTDDEFLKSLEENPAYRHIDLKTEIGKMEAWLLTKPGRRLTRRFILNWLNRVEKPLDVSDADPLAIGFGGAA